MYHTNRIIELYHTNRIILIVSYQSYQTMVIGEDIEKQNLYAIILTTADPSISKDSMNTLPGVTVRPIRSIIVTNYGNPESIKNRRKYTGKQLKQSSSWYSICFYKTKFTIIFAISFYDFSKNNNTGIK